MPRAEPGIRARPNHTITLGWNTMFAWLTNLFSIADDPAGMDPAGGMNEGLHAASMDDDLVINPASGLPMLDGCMDIGGNPYDFDAHADVGLMDDDMSGFGMHGGIGDDW